METSNTNVSLTENGDKAYATSGNYCLDFFTRIVRNAPPKDYIDAFQKAWSEDKETAVKLLFNMRDVRDGKGEKLIPVVLLTFLKNCLDSAVYEDLCRQFIAYGYWKDLLRVMEINLRTQRADKGRRARSEKHSVEIKLFVEQLQTDSKKVLSESDGSKKAAISLCAKWAPSENTHFDHEPIKFVKKITNEMGITPKEYRKLLTKLRAHIGVLETLMATQQYDKIDFSKLPSIAHKKMRDAFNRETNADGIESDARKLLCQSYKDYLQKLSLGQTKVNVKGIQPHELVEHYFSNKTFDALIEGQWQALLQRVKENGTFRDVTAIVDVSSSMSGQPMTVAIALGILVAKCTLGPFHGQVITFSDNPSWFHLTGATLQEQVNNMRQAPWGGSTNMKSVFDLILKQAIDAKLKPEEMVKTLFIFTDMQFNEVDRSQTASTFEDAKRNFETAGYKLPNIVCWNLRTSDTKTLPTTMDTAGVVMLSGFSSELLKYVLTANDFTPIAMMKHVLEKYEVPLSISTAPVTLSNRYDISSFEKGIEKSTFKKAFKGDKATENPTNVNDETDDTSDDDPPGEEDCDGF